MSGVRLIHGDCLDVLRTFEANSLDAIVTDPPFGVRDDKWDDMDSREFARFSMTWLVEARRIASELIAFCTQDSVLVDLCKLLYPRVRRLTWFKPEGSQYSGARECGVWFATETILHCHGREIRSVVEARDARVGRLIRTAREAKGLSRGGVDIAIRGKKTGLCYRWEEGACLPTPEQANALTGILGLDGEFREALREASEAKRETLDLAREAASERAARAIDVLVHRTVTNGGHPCEKPVPLMVELLETVGKPYRSILDPFMGSGATGKACVQCDRDFVGIEADPQYFELAERDISDERDRYALFDAPIPRPQSAGPSLPLFPER